MGFVAGFLHPGAQRQLDCQEGLERKELDPGQKFALK